MCRDIGTYCMVGQYLNLEDMLHLSKLNVVQSKTSLRLINLQILKVMT